MIASGERSWSGSTTQRVASRQYPALTALFPGYQVPSTNAFDRQALKYKQAVLPAGLPRIAVEMGVTDGWWKYGVAAVVGIDSFGESAPAGVLFKHFGFTAENVAATVQAALKRK